MSLENVQGPFAMKVSPDAFWRGQNMLINLGNAHHQDYFERMLFFSFISLYISFLLLLWKISITLVA